MNRVRYYSAAAEVAKLSGTLTTTYRTKNGRFILSEKQVNRILSQLKINDIEGLDVVEISEDEAHRLIQLGGYKMGEQK